MRTGGDSSVRSARRALQGLVASGMIATTGKGGPSDPWRYRTTPRGRRSSRRDMPPGNHFNFSRAQQAEAQERAESVAAAFDEAARRAGVSAETRRIEAGIGDVPAQFAHIARRFDLSVIGQFESGRDHPTKNIVIEATLFESGRPVLIVPFIQKDRLKLDHVMVCWDGSRAAARAVADAMPFLTRSGKASIVVADIQSAKSADLPGADIATHLTRHGVHVTIERIPVSKIDVSNTILSCAADTYPDLIVMGGYGHSRLREFILGGTTRGMLASMTKPTLMSH
jgi:nucleotide-binding universal stress UspA family protein